MRITEIYCSVQGETQYAGLPCTLVRTTGCDLRCGYCDSAFAFHGGSDLSLDRSRPRWIASALRSCC